MTLSKLDYRDRLRIEQMVRDGRSRSEIAKRIGVHYSTIWRELSRKGVWYEHDLGNGKAVWRYSADIAQGQYEYNKRAKGKMIKLGHDFALHDFIERKIGKEHYSPAAVVMEIKLQGLKFDVDICEKTIYNYIHSGDVFLTLTSKDLPYKRKKNQYRKVREAKRQNKGKGIEERPDVINDRTEPGHWEMDTVMSTHAGRKCALMLTERVTRAEIILPMRSCCVSEVLHKLDLLERRWGDKFTSVFKSITVDNGKEFSDYEGMMRSYTGGKRTQIYYCHPYRSNERGSNENQNRLFRRFYPKGTNLDLVSDEDIEKVADWINNYPRKLFNGKTSKTMFISWLGSLS